MISIQKYKTYKKGIKNVKFVGNFALANPFILPLAKQIMRDFHPALLDFKFIFFFMKKRSKELGSGIPVYDEDLLVVKHDASIFISYVDWMEGNRRFRVALLDHELSHFKVIQKTSGEYKLKAVDHEIEDFYNIIERHGNWWDPSGFTIRLDK